MTCENYLMLIDDLIEGELDAKSAAQVNSHVAFCPDCAAYFAALEEEKAVYAQYLSAVEPPQDLWSKVSAQIAAESAAVSTATQTAAVASTWKTNFFDWFRLYPALGFAAALIVLGIGLFKILPDSQVSEDENFARTDVNISAPPIQNPPVAATKAIEIPPVEIADAPKIVKAVNKSEVSNRKTNAQIPLKKVIKTPAAKPAITPGATKIDSPEIAELKEQQRQMQLLDKENARQIEKIELLLRSFRNARVIEGSALYDVAYEKQQARKLLDENVRLRQIAEVYGNIYAEEILGRAETFLLDIANLESNPEPAEILDIKERVKNQNIIASLQVY